MDLTQPIRSPAHVLLSERSVSTGAHANSKKKWTRREPSEKGKGFFTYEGARFSEEPAMGVKK